MGLISQKPKGNSAICESTLHSRYRRCSTKSLSPISIPGEGMAGTAVGYHMHSNSCIPWSKTLAPKPKILMTALRLGATQ